MAGVRRAISLYRDPPPATWPKLGDQAHIGALSCGAMAHVIEAAKSGRSSCRTCRQGIQKGDLRFGEEALNSFSDSGGTSYQWHHLKCAAQKRPHELRAAMETFAGEIPDREGIEATLREAESKVKPAFPYAERAPSARSRCIACEETIEKGSLRVAVEQEVQAAGFTTKAARYLHPPCVAGWSDDPELMAKVKKNSRGLSEVEQESIDALVSEGGKAEGPEA